MRIPVGGKTHVGIKVLANKAAVQPMDRALYEKSGAADQSFDLIEPAIAEELPQLKNPLVPHNVVSRCR